MSQSANNDISIFVIDPSAVMRHGFRFLAEKYDRLHMRGSGSTLSGALAQIKRTRPDVILLAISGNLADVAKEISTALESHPNLRILGYADQLEPTTVSVLIEAGIKGICSTGIDQDLLLAFESAINGALYLSADVAEEMRSMLSGEMPKILTPPISLQLTRREQDVLDLLAEGLTNQQIAEALELSIETVKAHLRRIMDKTGVRSRQNLMTEANRTC